MEKNATSGNPLPPEMAKVMGELRDKIADSNRKFLNYNPLNIIKVNSRLQDFNLEGEEVTLDDGTILRARDILDSEHIDAFIRGWLPYSETEIFKRIWLALKRGDLKSDIGSLSEKEEALVYLVEQDIELWVIYYALADYNAELAAIRPKEDAIEVLRRHPFVAEIKEKILAITAHSEEGQEAVAGFRPIEDVGIGGEEAPRWNPYDKKR